MPVIKDLERQTVNVKTNELLKPSLPLFMSYSSLLNQYIVTPKIENLGNYYIGIKLTDTFDASNSYKFVLNVKLPRPPQNASLYSTEIKAQLRIVQISSSGILSLQIIAKMGAQGLISQITNETLKIQRKNETSIEDLRYELLKPQDNSSIVKIKLLFKDPDVVSASSD